MDSSGHLFNTRYSGNFEDPNMHDEVFDMVADLNKRYLQVGRCPGLAQVVKAILSAGGPALVCLGPRGSKGPSAWACLG
jgi:hypothetical protein